MTNEFKLDEPEISTPGAVTISINTPAGPYTVAIEDGAFELQSPMPPIKTVAQRCLDLQSPMILERLPAQMVLMAKLYAAAVPVVRQQFVGVKPDWQPFALECFAVGELVINALGVGSKFVPPHVAEGLMADLNAHKADIGALTDSNESLRRQAAAKASAELLELRRELAAVSAERDELRDKLGEAYHGEELQQDAVDKLRKELGEATAACSAAKAAYDGACRQIQRIAIDRDHALQHVKTLQGLMARDAEAMNAALATERAAQAAAESEIKRLREEMETAKVAGNALIAQIAEASAAREEAERGEQIMAQTRDYAEKASLDKGLELLRVKEERDALLKELARLRANKSEGWYASKLPAQVAPPPWTKKSYPPGTPLSHMVPIMEPVAGSVENDPDSPSGRATALSATISAPYGRDAYQEAAAAMHPAVHTSGTAASVDELTPLIDDDDVPTLGTDQILNRMDPSAL